MAFDLSLWDKLSAAGNGSVRTLWGYSDSATALATLAASAYFNNVSDHLTIGDSIYMLGSDGNGQYEITAVSPNVTMSAATDPGALSETLADGDVFVGNVSNIATAVTLSGDFTITNAGVGTISAGAVDNSMLAVDVIQYAEVSIATAAVLLLATTPIELVAAPGAGLAVQFLGAQLLLDYATTQYTESADNLVIKYEQASGVAVSEVIECTGFIDQAADTLTSAVPVKDAIVAATGAVNKALVLDNNNANFAVGDSPLRLKVTYKVISTGF